MRLEVTSFPGAEPARRMIYTDRFGVRGLAVLRGFNISGHCKLDGTPCTPERAQEVLQRIADDGFNLVRLPVIWELLTDQVADRLVDFVRLAERHGLFLLVDLHQDLLGRAFHKPGAPEMHGTGFPEAVLRKAYGPEEPPFRTGSWDALAACVNHWQVNYRQNRQLLRCLDGLDKVYDEVKSFARRVRSMFEDCPNVIGYEVINEPVAPLVGDKYRTFYDAVRSELHDTLACAMPAADWLYQYVANTLPHLVTAGEPPNPGMIPSEMRDLAISTPHIYDPIAMTGVLAPTGKYGDTLEVIRRWHARFDLPFIVGEFGVPAGLHDAEKVLSKWVDVFDECGVSWCLWNLNPEATGDGNDHWCDEHMSVVSQRADGSVAFLQRYSALLRPFITVASGTISDARFVRDSFGWHFNATIGKSLDDGFQTKIVVPPALGDFDMGLPFTGTTYRKDGRVMTFSTNHAAVSFQIDQTIGPAAKGGLNI